MAYIEGLVKAFNTLVSHVVNEGEKDPLPGKYILGINGAQYIYDIKLVKSVSFELGLTKYKDMKLSCSIVLKNIMSHLLLREIENIIKTKKEKK